MGHWSREKGSYVIPSSQWADFKRKVREAYNDLQRKRREVAVQIWEDLKDTDVDKSFGQLFDKHAEKSRPAIGGQWTRTGTTSSYRLGSRHFDREMIENEIFRGDHDRPLKPRKKGFPEKTNRDTTFVIRSWRRPEIHFSNGSRTATWIVPKGKDAVRRAREHPVGSAFFSALSSVNWTRNSGGRIRYYDELMEHRLDDVQVKSRYGPRGKPSRSRA